MSRTLTCAAVAALVLAPAAAAALPQQGSLVPGRSLAGVRLGESAAAVRAALGGGYGVCQGCARTTWYFTYKAFDQQGLAVELSRGGRVSAVYTLWQPAGWRTPHGLQLGAVQAQVTKLAGTLIPVTCTGYEALVSDSQAVRTAYYIVDGKLWGFGLLAARETPCRG
jgi:hypothetical protein